MDTVIRDGALRHLLISDASCDVVLSCQGHRLMAHKLILSIASPVFRELLMDNYTDSSVIILPDVSGNTMTQILDYIYTGSVVIYSNAIQEFMALAKFFQINIEPNINNMLLKKPKTFEEIKDFTKEAIIKSESELTDEKTFKRTIKKCTKKIPNLLPFRHKTRTINTKARKNLCSYIIPSPWCPRKEKIFDPKIEETQTQITSLYYCPKKIVQNDRNNNVQITNKTIQYSEATNDLINQSNHLLATSFSADNFSEPQRDKNLPNNNSATPYQVATPKSPCHILPLNNWSSPVNMKTNNFDFHSITPKDLISSKTILHSTQTLIKNQEILLKSSPEHIKNPDISAAQSRDISTLPSIKDNTCESSTSCSNENDDLIHQVKENIETREKEKPYKCKDCSKEFSQLRNYKYHRSLHEGTKEFSAKCPECGKTFNDKGYLSSHMKIHRDKKEYACPNCPKRFNQRVAYNMHMRIHTGVKPHECTICGKSFSRKMLLKQHQRVHTGERPYSCPECGKTFADRSNMSLHTRLHTGIKPYSCNICSKSFTKKHHLKTHMNFHTGLKPYTCQKCGLAFSQSSNMRTHFKKCMLKSSDDIPPSPGSVGEKKEDSS